MDRDKQSIQNARLLPSEIPGIRERVRTHATTVYQEADRYGVGVETIRRAVRGETFRNVREGLAVPQTDEVGPKYGRRATDVVSAEDADRSLEKLLRDQQARETDPTKGVVDEFLSQRGGGPEERRGPVDPMDEEQGNGGLPIPEDKP